MKFLKAFEDDHKEKIESKALPLADTEEKTIELPEETTKTLLQSPDAI